MVLEINEDVDDYNDVTAGQTIIIPNDYFQEWYCSSIRS